MKKFKKDDCRCDSCSNCIYIGEGDFICTVSDPVLVMEDFCPSDNYLYCDGLDYEDSDGDYEQEM